MTLQTLVKTVMESNGWPTPVSEVSSSTDPNMKQAMALANKALQSLCFSKDWPILIVPYEFTTVGGQATYPLPADFHHMIVHTLWDKTAYYQLRGNLQPREWIPYQLGLIPVKTGFRIFPRTREFTIVPTPVGVDNMVFEYYTKNLVRPATGADQTIYTLDSDQAILDETLVELALSWRWRQKKGLDFSAEIAEYEGTLAQRYAQNLALPDIPVGSTPTGDPLTDGYLGPNFNNTFYL